MMISLWALCSHSVWMLSALSTAGGLLVQLVVVAVLVIQFSSGWMIDDRWRWWVTSRAGLQIVGDVLLGWAIALLRTWLFGSDGRPVSSCATGAMFWETMGFSTLVMLGVAVCLLLTGGLTSIISSTVSARRRPQKPE